MFFIYLLSIQWNFHKLPSIQENIELFSLRLFLSYNSLYSLFLEGLLNICQTSLIISFMSLKLLGELSSHLFFSSSSLSQAMSSLFFVIIIICYFSLQLCLSNLLTNYTIILASSWNHWGD